MSRTAKLQDDVATCPAQKAASRPYGNNAYPASPSHTAAYIHDIARELHLMARRAELTFLAYLLDMASDEAERRKHLPERAGER